jgi:hypothetical protein
MELLLFLTFFILFHILGDIVLQPKRHELDKHENFLHLFEHSLFYSLVMSLPIMLNEFFTIFTYNIKNENHLNLTLMFVGVMFITHLIVDYFFSKIIENNKNNSKKFLLSVQLDQLIHYITIFITLKFIYF